MPKILLVSNHEWGKSLAQLDREARHQGGRILLINHRLIADDSPAQVMIPTNL